LKLETLMQNLTHCHMMFTHSLHSYCDYGG
jgi:hypothetical protein